jgi:hypothetical protein
MSDDIIQWANQSPANENSFRKLTILFAHGGLGLIRVYLVGIIEYEIVQNTHGPIYEIGDKRPK